MRLAQALQVAGRIADDPASFEFAGACGMRAIQIRLAEKIREPDGHASVET